MNLKIALLAAAGTLALGAGAMAQEAGDTYGALGAGIAIGNDNNTFRSQGATPVDFIGEMELDDNITIYGALGRYFEGGLRGEIELATRSQNIDSIPGDGLGFGGFPNQGSSLGELSATTLMANVYKDFAVDAAGRLTPYVGVGVGAARVRPEFDNLGTAPAAVIDDAPSGYRIVASDKEYVLAGQAMAGLSFDFTDNMMIDVRYKYLMTDKYDFGGYVNNLFTEMNGNYAVHEVTGGLRWNFGGSAPAPAPVAAPAPEPVTQYKTCFDGSRVPVSQDCPPQIEDEVEVPEDLELTVYFDYDRATLTDASQAIIAARAAEAREYDISTITVQGNTDTSGSASYNQRLSQRRANVVRDALVANGIDASVITIEALGESNPARATGDGVREPLNRRTEVEFNFDMMGM